MRLCTIVFLKNNSLKAKEYTFKIPKMPYIKKGCILRNTKYQNTPMKVVKVFDYPIDEFYNGFKLRELFPNDTQVEIPSTRFNNNQMNNNMESRNITVSLEEARNWYNGKDQTLRRLALQVYTEKELNEPQNFKEVLNFLEVKNLELNIQLACKEASSTMRLTKEIGSELTFYMKLRLIAKYFNGTWKPTIDKTKYFLTMIHPYYNLPNSIKLNNAYCIGIHEKVLYPGIVYFQNQDDVRKAYEMLKDELK